MNSFSEPGELLNLYCIAVQVKSNVYTITLLIPRHCTGQANVHGDWEYSELSVLYILCSVVFVVREELWLSLRVAKLVGVADCL